MVFGCPLYVKFQPTKNIYKLDYCDNLFVKRTPTLCFARIGINNYLLDALLIQGILFKITFNKVISV